MPEGPSIVILREQAASFVGRRILRVAGNTTINKERLLGQTILDMRSYGKQFLLQLPGFALRVHLMLWGSYRIVPPPTRIRRDYGPDRRTPRLSLGFARGRELNFYACSVKFVEGELDALYDWSTDVMSDAWSPRKARRKLAQQPNALVCDALLDQDVFAGSGNVIKNEVLFRIRVHPESRIGALPPRKLGELIRQARVFSFDFYRWRKASVLRKNCQVYTKTICPRCKIRLQYRAELGTRRRRVFFCDRCQVRYR